MTLKNDSALQTKSRRKNLSQRLVIKALSVSSHHSAQSPPSAELRLWTTHRDGEVKLRVGDSGVAAEEPLTVNQMFAAAAERFGDFTALGWKEGEQQKTLTYREYYQACRTAAKGFLKVGFLLSC